MEKLLTLDEVAKYLRVSQRTILRYIYSKKIKAYRIGQWRISPKDLEAFMRKTSN